MCSPDNKIPEQISRVLNVIPKPFLDVILLLHRKLDDLDVGWAVSGTLGEALKVVKIDPDCVEIVTTKVDAKRIFQALSEYNPHEVDSMVQRLPRNARIGEKEYPVYTRSYYFEFFVEGIMVRVYGDLQYRVNDWDWGDKLEFTPEYVFVTDKKTAVVPLSVKCEIYQSLGWTDRVEKIRQATEKPKPPIKSGA
jgi:hypothetical protein